MRTSLWLRRLFATFALVAASGAPAGSGGRRAERSLSEADRIVAGLEAVSAREGRLVESFATNKTFTVAHGEQVKAQVVAALSFTAPDVKVFAVIESRGSDFIRTRVINRMMAAEIEASRIGSRTRVAISSDNYEFGSVLDDGDAFVVEAVPRRRDDLLFKGRVWITKDGFHLKRIEGEPARNPSFWTGRIQFVSDFEPVNGIWMQVRTLARVTVRWMGEYHVRSECGPYRMSLVVDPPIVPF